MDPKKNKIFITNKLTPGSTLPLDALIGEPFVNLYEGRLFFSGVTGGSYTGVTGQPNVFEVGSNVDYLNAASGITAPYAYITSLSAGTIYSGTTNLYDIFQTQGSDAIHWTSGSTGTYSVKIINDSTTDATGNYAIADGENTLASGLNSYAGGYSSNGTTNPVLASGNYSFNFSVCYDTGRGCYGNYAAILGGQDTLIGSNGSYSSVIGGSGNKVYPSYAGVFVGYGNNVGVSGYRSVIVGGRNQTLDVEDMVMVPNLMISSFGTGTPVNSVGIDSDGQLIIGNSVLWEEGTGTNSAKLISQSNMVPGINAVSIGEGNISGGFASGGITGPIITTNIYSTGDYSFTCLITDYLTGALTATVVNSKGTTFTDIPIVSAIDDGHGAIEITLISQVGVVVSVAFTTGDIYTSNDFTTGYNNQALGGNSAVVGGSGNTISTGVTNSVVIGGFNITGLTKNTVYVPHLNINDITGIGTSVNNLGIDIDGNVVSGALFYNYYTTGVTLNNSTLIFDRNDYLSAYTVNLESISNLTNYFPVTGGTINGDVTITGNVLIYGTATTIHSETLAINDNIITLNANQTGTTTPIVIDSGIEILRNSATTASLIWSEANQRWEAGLTGSTEEIILAPIFSAHTGNTDIHQTISQTDDRYVNITGDTMTGNLIITGASIGIGTISPYTKLHIIGDGFSATGKTTDTIISSGIAGNGSYLGSLGFKASGGSSTVRSAIVGIQDSSDSDRLGLSFFTHPSNIAGDPLVEVMRISSFGYVGIGTSTPDYKLDVDGDTRILSGLTLSFLTASTEDNILVSDGSGNVSKRDISTIASSTTFSDLYVNITGDTMTGGLTISGSVSGETLLDISGTTGGLFSVNDIDDGILNVYNSTDNVIFSIDNYGYIHHLSYSDVISSITTLCSFTSSTASSAFIDYSINNGTAYRAGTIQSIWNGSNVEYNEISTADLGGSTSGITFSMDISSGNVRLIATPTIGTWEIKLSVKLI